MSYSALLKKSWDSIKDNLPLVAALTLVMLMAGWASSIVPFAGQILAGVLNLGYVRCLIRIRQKEEITYSDFFWGFLNFNRLAHALLYQLLYWIIVAVGVIFFIVPGIWAFIALALAPIILVLTDTDSVSALQESKELTKGHWWSIFGLMFVLVGLFIVGAMCFLIGLLVTIPMSSLILIHATEELMEKTKGAKLAPSSTDPSVLTVNPSVN